MSATPFLSDGPVTHGDPSLHGKSAFDTNAMNRPSALMLGDMLGPAGRPPASVRSSRVRTPEVSRIIYMPTELPTVSTASSRSVAVDSKTTAVPSAVMAGLELVPFAGSPCAFA